MGYKSKFNGAEIDEKLSASGLFLWFIPSDIYASYYNLTEEEFQAMIVHNTEVYKVLDSIFKNKGYVPNIDLVGFAFNGVSYYGRASVKINTVTAYVLAENGTEPEKWGSYNYGDTVIEFSSDNYSEIANREIYDTLCPDGRFYYQRSSGGGPV